MAEIKIISEIIFNNLESQKEHFTPSDFRFYNIGHLPILAKRSETYSNECPICKNNLHALALQSEQLSKKLQDFKKRKAFDALKRDIERHLKHEHGHRYPGHYLALYSFIGTTIGLALGYPVARILTPLDQTNTWLIITGAMLIIATIMGKQKDKKLAKADKQI